MADAEIIPLGTRGEPGRGSGRSSSSAARRLAGGAGASRPARRKKTDGAEEPDGVRDAVGQDPAAQPDSAAPEAAEPDGSAPGSTEPGSTEPDATEPDATGPDGTGAEHEPTQVATTTDRHPLGGIPPADWQAALDSAAREVFGTDWEPQLARFLAFLRRRVTGQYDVDDYGFDRELTERFLLAMLRPIKEKWFRIEVRGIDNIPTDGGALVVSNHSGTLPMDGLMTMVTIHDHVGRDLRPLGADLVFRMPFIGMLARKAGATLACSEDAERMLCDGELVGVWPEGFKGIGKPYSERYKLQRFGRGGFVSAALRTGVPIVPLAVVGAEEIYPLVGNIPALAKVLGIPYLPITPFFPLLGPLGMIPLPSKWLMEFGEPIRTDAYDDGEADDPMLVFNVTDQVRETIQQTLYSLLMQRESVFR
ncbi:1-acyl-sn-glycerol-3-phosphate acyltransferase [Nocardioides cheoyonin]|uniref:1-acyl-sn-glycerol-3-phosphate acyltransferase n=1 Tax=Nocardioides cheoyonin TaxID=3156615 RepID=UPI0032B3B3D7